ncbi:hypothetical protein BH23PLA1_BH23PLA1_11670 [soil metagenome]
MVSVGQDLSHKRGQRAHPVRAALDRHRCDARTGRTNAATIFIGDPAMREERTVEFSDDLG